MKRWRKTRLPGRKPWLPLLALLLGGAAFFWLNTQLRPVMETIASNEAKRMSIATINDAVIREMSAEEISYASLIHLERSTDGVVQSVTTDMVRMNELKAKVLEDIQAELGEGEHSQIGVPLGTLLNNEFLHGRGPEIPLRLTLSGNVNAEFDSTFTSAGLNQTRHRIFLRVHTSVYSFLPGVSAATEVITDVPVAETVIVGEVPSFLPIQGGYGTGAEVQVADGTPDGEA